ncbi:cupin domain-containing protein [Halanaerobium sp. MA284_MarDTE_T2]|uniref:cupin domain-containing protein n=1 Tax=Halanaerobium sp. MA284_MarDTE_T2 TaxID=2183913 RepID=UPI000DF1EA3D|nr:cupin domain-containing protein [Halanaerobium sp. MA284_MarDTE_T2]RCW48639.1 quercetin dioxygenase-like cupin family protein [Halanaerobium sp. MA284_MarDTE_T2]
MIIKKNSDVKKVDLSGQEGVKKTYKKVLVGPEDGDVNFIMRYFIVEPGGNTPLHKHNWEHENYFIKGRGIMVSDGDEHEIGPEMSAYVKANETHQFKNPYDENFEFLCLIPINKQGEK